MTEDVGTRDCVLVVNPQSGNGNHIETIRELAAEHGFEVAVSESGDHAVSLAREAAESGATRIGACGGDGTINQVVRGIDAADAFDEVTFGVVPAGTGNNFAGNVGVESIEHGIELLAEGETRTIDLGTAGDELFVNSCICGLTANASGETSSDLKDRFGPLAYVFKTIETMTEFEAIPLHVHAEDEGALWDGDAVFVLIGNARSFPAGGDGQGDAEDGLLEVTIVEDVPTNQLLRDATVSHLLGGETASISRLRTPSLTVDVRREEPVSFSFDGEMASFQSLSCRVRPRTLSVRVGEGYRTESDADADDAESKSV
ncbi:diacylglycerol/lipid kinase family protein [Halalkalicoccus ordinarius]|uniref:diacylglycerol/lipid kinase family protein n=1 Tax=Halalkalicoccus ordinarius TaxID=3116651 RepID=UPI00300E72ED